MNREKTIIKTSIVGILGNLVLVVFKMIIGLAANSIAIILDAVNNLSDALSSIITIVGTKLAGKAPDKKHPYGYGRIEYLTSVLISGIVIAAGGVSIKESIEKIISPETSNYSYITLIIIAVAVVVKLVMGTYVKNMGKKVNSQSLIASGSDAFFDAILSIATLVGAAIYLIWKVSLEGWIAAVISLIIIKAGLEMLGETLHLIIGERADRELTLKLKALVRDVPGVKGAYDVALHTYGPTKTVGSVHVEVDDDMPAKEIHILTNRIIAKVYEELGIVLTVGIYASNTTDDKTMEIRQKVVKLVEKYPEVIQIHGFFRDDKFVSFDMVIDFKADMDGIRNTVKDQIGKLYPDYTFSISIDPDISD